MNHTVAAAGTATEGETSQPRRSPQSGWQSDDSVIRCGRLLSLSQSLRSALTELRRSIAAAFCEPPPPSAESWESSDTTLVENS